MDYCGIKEYLRPELDRVMEIISGSLASDIGLLDRTNSSLLEHSGKHLRPVISLLVAKACSGGSVTEDSLHFAATSELLHNATLLHDDVADNSPVRHGVPTVMSVLGERAAVLLGDYWLVKGMENILMSGNSCGRVTRVFSKTLSNLAEGELLQLQKASSGDTSEEDYFRIIYNKTASLFEASAVSAAISVSSPEVKIRASGEYAVALGMAFQIRDDMLDYEGGSGLGKPSGQDLSERKITLPLLGALKNVPEEEAGRIRKMVCEIDEHPEYQQDIVEFVKSGPGMEYAGERLAEYVGKARSSLIPLGGGRDVEMLAALADFVAARKS